MNPDLDRFYLCSARDSDSPDISAENVAKLVGKKVNMETAVTLRYDSGANAILGIPENLADIREGVLETVLPPSRVNK